MKRKALVIGATGLIGRNVVKLLLQNNEYEKVTILVRKSSDICHEKLEEVIINFQNLEEYKSFFQVNDVFSCLGTTIKIAKTKEKFREVDYAYTIKAAQIASEVSVQNFLMISSLGANSQSNIFYYKVKGEVERDVLKIKFKGLFIFRPSLLLGDRQQFRFGEKFAEKISNVMPFLFSGPFIKYRPINAINVAKTMIICATSDLHGTQIIESNKIESMSNNYQKN